MYKCQMILWLAVLAMLMSAISGFFIPFLEQEQQPQQQKNKVHFADTPLGQILRQTRDIDNEDHVNATFLEITIPCNEEMQCFTGSVIENVISTVGPLDLEGAINEIPDDCAAETPACDVSGCTDEHMLKEFQLNSELFELACANKAPIVAGAACWKTPFHNNVMECFQTYPPKALYSPTVTALMDCLARVPEVIDTCSQGDITFFDNFTDQMLALLRGTHAEAQ